MEPKCNKNNHPVRPSLCSPTLHAALVTRATYSYSGWADCSEHWRSSSALPHSVVRFIHARIFFCIHQVQGVTIVCCHLCVFHPVLQDFTFCVFRIHHDFAWCCPLAEYKIVPRCRSAPGQVEVGSTWHGQGYQAEVMRSGDWPHLAPICQTRAH